ncbi:MAG: hypothetical protein ACKO3N_14785, partial [Verrucomicrobiota bacterium]
MNSHPSQPSRADPDSGAEAFERRLGSVPFRAVPPDWRPSAVTGRKPAAACPARPARPAGWREWLPTGWLGPALAGAWLLAILLNWDAGRQAAPGQSRLPRLTVAQWRVQMDLRRQLMAQLDRPDNLPPTHPPAVTRPAPGPRSERPSGPRLPRLGR